MGLSRTLISIVAAGVVFLLVIFLLFQVLVHYQDYFLLFNTVELTFLRLFVLFLSFSAASFTFHTINRSSKSFKLDLE